jgi:TfoX/Sxy family transcriptional regulator of competence genes
MDYKWRVRQAALAVMVLFGGIEAGCAQPLPQNAGTTTQPAVQAAPAASEALPTAAPAAQSVAQSQTIALTPDEAQQSPAGNVAELQQMIRGSDLNELRTTYNGTYGASLLFYGKEMTYYVALFQNKTFWRVIKTSDETRAEAIYRDFALKTQQLSEVEIRRIRLEAQKAFTDRMIALTQDHANRLQADLNVAQQQQALVLDQQKQTRDQANALQVEKSAAQDQLRTVQRQVRELQRQVEGGLPGQ